MPIGNIYIYTYIFVDIIEKKSLKKNVIMKYFLDIYTTTRIHRFFFIFVVKKKKKEKKVKVKIVVCSQLKICRVMFQKYISRLQKF